MTDRGNRRDPLFSDEDDWRLWLGCLADACARTDIEVLSYCGMSNHTHLLLRSAGGQVTDGMWALKSFFANRLKARHDIVGAVFERRFHGRLVTTDAHYLEAMRYIALNPVRAGVAGRPEDHRRSAHAALVGIVPTPRFLQRATALELLGGQAVYEQAVVDRAEQDQRDAAAALLRHERRHHRNSRVDAIDVNDLVKRQGLSPSEVADRLGVDRATIRRALRRHRAGG